MINQSMKKALSAALAVILSTPAGVLPAFAAESGPAPVEFQGVEVTDDLVTIKLSTAVLYNSFLTQTPPRLVMELLDTKHEGPTRSAKGQGAFLAGVRSSQFEKSPRLITRVVLDLVKMAGYKVGTTKGGLTVQIVGSVDDQAAAPAPAPAPVVAKRAAAAAAPKAPVAATPALQAPVAAPMPKSAQTSVIVPPLPAAETKAKARLNITAAQAMKRAGLDGTMSQELAATAQGSDVTKTKIDPAGEGDGDEPQRARGGRIYSDIMSRLPRDLVTLDFDNTDIRDVLRLLAAKAKVNIVFGPDVAGSLTLHLTNVPFNEAFRTALSMMKLTTDQVGGHILRVITPAELKNQRTSSTATTKVYVLNYAKAAEVKATIDAVRTAEGRGGSSTADVKTNTLIVTDSLEGQIATENLISQMDQRPRQVLIETKIVEINANAGLNYGVQWDYASIDVGKSMGKQGSTSVGSTMGVTDPFVNPRQGSGLDRNPVTFGGISPAGGIGAAGRGTGVALAADRVFGALTLGRITNNFILNATLTAAASEGKAKILSEPKIATLNNQAADINITTQIPYVTSNVASTGVQTQTVSYVTTGIQLKVTPSINADGRITLQVNPIVSQPSATASASSTGAPAVDARTANTTVLVRDGETIVIGGLITDTMQDTISKIPLLGDIPVLGWLFKKKSKTRVRAELLIFVTTRILPD